MSLSVAALYAIAAGHVLYSYHHRKHMSQLTTALNQLQTDTAAAAARVSADLQNTFTASDLALVASIDAAVNAIDPAPAPAPTPTPTPTPTPVPTPTS